MLTNKNNVTKLFKLQQYVSNRWINCLNRQIKTTLPIVKVAHCFANKNCKLTRLYVQQIYIDCYAQNTNNCLVKPNSSLTKYLTYTKNIINVDVDEHYSYTQLCILFVYMINLYNPNYIPLMCQINKLSSKRIKTNKNLLENVSLKISETEQYFVFMERYKTLHLTIH